VLGARRRAPPTRSRSPVTIDAHRCPKRTEQFHPTQKGPAAQSERNHSTLHKKAPLPKANGTIPPYTKRPRCPKRTERFHPTQKGPAAQSERNHSTLHTKAPLPEANGTIPPYKKAPATQSEPNNIGTLCHPPPHSPSCSTLIPLNM